MLDMRICYKPLIIIMYVHICWIYHIVYIILRFVLNIVVNTRTLLVVSGCLKDPAFHNRTVYVTSLDPNGIVWQLGKPHGFVRCLAWAVGLFTKVCAGRINYLELSCLFHYPLTVWRHIFTRCSQRGKLTFGNILCTFKGAIPVRKSQRTSFAVLLMWWFKWNRLIKHEERSSSFYLRNRNFSTGLWGSEPDRARPLLPCASMPCGSWPIYSWCTHGNDVEHICTESWDALVVKYGAN